MTTNTPRTESKKEEFLRLLERTRNRSPLSTAEEEANASLLLKLYNQLSDQEKQSKEVKDVEARFTEYLKSQGVNHQIVPYIHDNELQQNWQKPRPQPEFSLQNLKREGWEVHVVPSSGRVRDSIELLAVGRATELPKDEAVTVRKDGHDVQFKRDNEGMEITGTNRKAMCEAIRDAGMNPLLLDFARCPNLGAEDFNAAQEAGLELTNPVTGKPFTSAGEFVRAVNDGSAVDAIEAMKAAERPSHSPVPQTDQQAAASATIPVPQPSGASS